MIFWPRAAQPCKKACLETDEPSVFEKEAI